MVALRQGAGLYQTDIARAVPCHRTNVTHAEAGSQLPEAHFWETADRVVGANGALIARYDAFIQAKQAHAAKRQAQRRAKAQATAQQLQMTPHPQSHALSVSSDAAANTTLSQLEIVRSDLNKTITDNTMTAASLDEWEQAVFQHGQTTRHRVPRVLLEDLSVDLVELRAALARCRSSSALRRLTRVLAQMAGLMCLTLIKMDERTAFRGWARTARLAADEAGDPLTHSWVRAQEAYGHYYSGDLTEAIHVAQHAQVLSGQGWSAGAVLAAALEARAQAALGRADATRSALQRAEACLSHLAAGSIGTSAFDYNEAQLRFHEGNALTHLHDTNAAWQAQDRALSLCPASDYMDRTMTQLDRATCLAHDGDVSGAVAILVQATTALTDQQCQGIIAAGPKDHRDLAAAAPHTVRSARPARSAATVARDEGQFLVVEIRPAELRDVDALAVLMEDLDLFYGATDVKPPDQRMRQISESLFEEPVAAYVLLAWEEKQTVGMAAYSFLWPAAGVTRSLYLKELYVTEAFRRKGIGALLMRRLCQVAVEYECSRLEWTADQDNALAEAFYEQLGIPKNQEKMIYRLEGDGLRRLAAWGPSSVVQTQVLPGGYPGSTGKGR